MLKKIVADQCTKRHKNNFQPGCLDVFDKNKYALIHICVAEGCSKINFVVTLKSICHMSQSFLILHISPLTL